MIAEKPSWIKHGGTQIFSVDIQSGGLRFATGGGDHKVRIWNMKSVSRELKADDSSQKLLATLRDHFGPVNCVRWAKHGRYIASGSDDQVILVYERKPGSGTTEFGSGEPPEVENWKVSITLRGHTADVVDLNWSPDDLTLASGSLDNTIHIWDMNVGICTAVLRGHPSLVKGVTWDPISSFLASQSDDKTVIIWRTSDWSVAHRSDGHWAKSLGTTFFRRLDWSPCGHFVTTTHGFQKHRHSAPVLERGEWTNKSLSVGRSNGSSKTDGIELLPYNVIALGSQDCTISVWTTSSPRPLFIAKQIFSQSVVDLTWSPDGYSLFACSLDGTVATFHFDINEIGYKLSDTELDELKRNRYGDTRGRQGSLAETPTQLMLEAVSIKPTPIKKMNPVIPENQASLKPSTGLVGTTQTEENLVNDDKQTKNSITGGSKIVVAARTSSPVKQKGYRRADGRKRIIPEAVGGTSAVQNEGLEFHSKSSDGRNDYNGVIHSDSGVREGLKCKLTNGNSGVRARATISESLVVEKIPVSESKEGTKNVEQIGRVACGSKLVISIVDNRRGGDALPLRLEAQPRESAVNDILGAGNTSMIKETELMCTKGSVKVWSDRISGKVTVLAGNSNFWAVGCEDGGLQVYTECGRRAIPPMMIGSAAVFVDCDESWRFMLVTKNGSLYVWDLFSRKCLLHDSLASLIATNPTETGTVKIISAKLSTCGYPLVKMATRHAYLFDMSLMCWLRVADESFPTSNYASSWNFGSSAHGGELGQLQVDVWKFLARKPGWSRVTDDGVQTRAYLEAQMASALALKSPTEYHQSLLSYIRFLTRENDESRLREVCESFLGPPIGMAGSGSSDLTPAWDPSVLGMDKHKLHQEDILPAMASNRKVQRLFNEFMELLSEYNTTVTNLADENLTETNKIDTDPPQMDKVNSESTLATQTASTEPPAIHATDPPSQLGDPMQLQTDPSISEQMDVDPSATDQLDAPLVVTIDGSLP